MTQALKPGSWVVIDEIQRVPELLQEVHALYEGQRLHFALSGSSARKLKRGGANLLAARALQVYLFPFVYPEFKGTIDIQQAVDWGTLPGVVTEKEFRTETLETYLETYLRQELLEEGIIRSLPPFARFLEVAGIHNGQVLNYENVARECHVGRTTVQTYFDVLEDTMIGFRLPALGAGVKAKEISHPKFYFFDSGVARSAAGLLREHLDASYRGFLFETFLINQIRSYNHYTRKERQLYFYGISGGGDIDLLVETKKKTLSSTGDLIAFEFKAATRWKSEWNYGVNSFAASSKRKVRRKIGVYQGNDKLAFGDFEVWPVIEFLNALFAEEFF